MEHTIPIGGGPASPVREPVQHGGVPPTPAPHELLDDGFAPPACEVAVIGCGNLLRGDDAVGPTAIRELWLRGVPDGVRLIDGGTAGMDVAFMMRGARRVVIVDAASTGALPGTVFRVPGTELTALPAVDGIHSHAFRWDHALSFGHWLLGPQMPADIEVFLIEVAQTEPGAELSAAVRAGMERTVELILAALGEGERQGFGERGEAT